MLPNISEKFCEFPKVQKKENSYFDSCSRESGAWNI